MERVPRDRQRVLRDRERDLRATERIQGVWASVPRDHKRDPRGRERVLRDGERVHKTMNAFPEPVNACGAARNAFPATRNASDWPGKAIRPRGNAFRPALTPAPLPSAPFPAHRERNRETRKGIRLSAFLVGGEEEIRRRAFLDLPRQDVRGPGVEKDLVAARRAFGEGPGAVDGLQQIRLAGAEGDLIAVVDAEPGRKASVDIRGRITSPDPPIQKRY